MGWIRRLGRTLVGSNVGHDFDEEMRFHLAQRTEENIRLGMNPQDARAAATRRFGNVTLTKERTEDVNMLVISYQTWHERFHGDPAIIGQTQMLNGFPFTIVGVAPEGFYGTFVGYAFQFWVPASMQAQFSTGNYKLEDRGARWIEGFVRLKSGVTIEQAQAESSSVMARLESQYPESNVPRDRDRWACSVYCAGM